MKEYLKTVRSWCYLVIFIYHICLLIENHKILLAFQKGKQQQQEKGDME